MSIAVVVPLALDGDARTAAWAEVSDWLDRAHPAWPVVVGRGNLDDWCKGEALALAVARTDADVLVVHDADVIVDPAALELAARECEAGAAWALPHSTVHRLGRETTAAIYAGEIPFPPPVPLYDRPPYRGVIGGGCTVVRRDTWDACPVDPRFRSWGSEDECWGRGLVTLFGQAHRSTAPLWHFWHPHPAPHQRRNARPEAENLWRAYRRAVGDPRLMGLVLDGCRPRAAVGHGTLPPHAV